MPFTTPCGVQRSPSAIRNPFPDEQRHRRYRRWLWNLCNVLKDDGVTYHQYVTELTYLLFLKMAKETGTEDQIPAGYRWDDLEAQPPPLRSILQATAAELGIRGSRLVKDLWQRQQLHQKSRRRCRRWSADRQAGLVQRAKKGLGDLYEGLLEKNANEKKSQGRVSTSRRAR